ncbi:MAG: DUF58 domain-containing protein [Actinomycetota bacterium]|nr:DUF58 domain-containing protein [Actinomycetota bacterium]
MTSSVGSGSVRLDWRVAPFSVHLLVLAALAVVGLMVVPGPATVVGLASVLLLVTLVLTNRRPSSLSVELSTSTSRCTVGDVVRFGLSWTADDSVHVTGFADAALFVELAGRQPLHLPARRTASFYLRPTGWRVGSPGALQLQVATRYGGWSATVRLVLPDLIVHPELEQQPGVYAPPQLLSRLGLHVGRTRGIGTDFAELREYATGDPLRDVNWRALAHTGELMVSQRYRDQAADVVVLVDHLALWDVYDRGLTDAAVRGGAAVARAYLAAGDRVGLVLYGSPIRWIPPGQGRAQEMRLLDQIVQPPPLNSYLDPEVARIPRAALPPRAVVFCFSALLDGRIVSAIGRLASRGHRLVVIDLAGVEPRGWPKGLSESTPQVWREHRLLLRARLSEQGAMVVDEPSSVVAAVRLMARRGVA